MFSDVTELGVRLRVAYLSLLTAAGCTAPVQPAAERPTAGTVETEVEPKVEPKVEAKVEAKVEPKIEPEPVEPELVEPVDEPPPPPPPPPRDFFNRPTCPTITWVGTAAEAKKYADEDAAIKHGCPDRLSGAGSPRGEGPPHRDMRLDEAATAALGEGECSYQWVMPCPGGRPLLSDDAPLRADVSPGTAWLAELAPTRAIPEALRAEIVAGWLFDARSEHASVASFARATLELMALAAPPALIAATQRASLDEVEHAQLCFALASRCGGVALEPGPLPAVAPRPSELARLACDTFVEGCVGETIAALAASRAARGCDDPTVADVLAQIADDEARHAALAWATVAWAVERGGEPVRDAVRDLAARLRREALSADAPAAHPSAAALARHGRLDAAAQHACVVDAWQRLIPDALADLLGEPLTLAAS